MMTIRLVLGNWDVKDGIKRKTTMSLERVITIHNLSSQDSLWEWGHCNFVYFKTDWICKQPIQKH
jgi:hypothetical protein